MIHIIVAIDQNRAIGLGGDMLFHIREDLRRFKALTMGHTLVMGRKTFDSLPSGALPGRRNIVITRNEHWSAPGAERAASLADAIALAGDSEIYIIGGGEIYAQALPLADVLDLTQIHAAAPEADTYFPPFADLFTETGRTDTPDYSFITLRANRL